MTTLHNAAREALEALNAMLTHMGMDEDEWNKPTFNQARAALATLRAALSEAPGEERDERAAFEDWIAPTLRNGSHLNRSRVNQVYTDNRVAAKWAAWQARAMLAARPSGPQGEPAAWLCEYRSGEEFVSLAKDPMLDPDVMSAFPLYTARPSAPTVALTEERCKSTHPDARRPDATCPCHLCGFLGGCALARVTEGKEGGA